MRTATGEADNYAVHGQLLQMSGTQEGCCDWLHTSWQLGQVVQLSQSQSGGLKREE